MFWLQPVFCLCVLLLPPLLPVLECVSAACTGSTFAMVKWDIQYISAGKGVGKHRLPASRAQGNVLCSHVSVITCLQSDFWDTFKILCNTLWKKQMVLAGETNSNDTFCCSLVNRVGSWQATYSSAHLFFTPVYDVSTAESLQYSSCRSAFLLACMFICNAATEDWAQTTAILGTFCSVLPNCTCSACKCSCCRSLGHGCKQSHKILGQDHMKVAHCNAVGS